MSDLESDINKMRQQIGKVGITYQIEVDKSMIRKFCEAVGHLNPPQRDPNNASKNRDDDVVAPPWILFAASFARQENPDTRPHINRLNLDGGGEWEFYLPIRAGDIITVESELVDLSGRLGKNGVPRYFEKIETRWTNQRGELVGKNVNTLITR